MGTILQICYKNVIGIVHLTNLKSVNQFYKLLAKCKKG